MEILLVMLLVPLVIMILDRTVLPMKWTCRVFGWHNGNGTAPDFYDYNYFAFPHVFSTTAGPAGGIGGAALTRFTVHAYELSNGFTLYTCEGCYVLKQEEFNSTLKINSFSESDWKKI